MTDGRYRGSVWGVGRARRANPQSDAEGPKWGKRERKSRGEVPDPGPIQQHGKARDGDAKKEGKQNGTGVMQSQRKTHTLNLRQPWEGSAQTAGRPERSPAPLQPCTTRGPEQAGSRNFDGGSGVGRTSARWRPDLMTRWRMSQTSPRSTPPRSRSSRTGRRGR